MKHKPSAKKFLTHRIRHKYLKLNKSPAQIADEMPGIDPEFIGRVCDVAFGEIKDDNKTV